MALTERIYVLHVVIANGSVVLNKNPWLSLFARDVQLYGCDGMYRFTGFFRWVVNGMAQRILRQT